jgi:hypothetical protein
MSARTLPGRSGRSYPETVDDDVELERLRRRLSVVCRCCGQLCRICGAAKDPERVSNPTGPPAKRASLLANSRPTAKIVCPNSAKSRLHAWEGFALACGAGRWCSAAVDSPAAFIVGGWAGATALYAARSPSCATIAGSWSFPPSRVNRRVLRALRRSDELLR